MSEPAHGDRVRLVESARADVALGTEGTVWHVSHLFDEVTFYVMWDSGQPQAIMPDKGDVIELTAGKEAAS